MMRRAFSAALKDKTFLAEAGRLSLEVDPLTGEEIAALLIKAYSAPRAVIAEAAQLAK